MFYLKAFFTLLPILAFQFDSYTDYLNENVEVMSTKNQRVKSWLPTIQLVRQDQGFSESDYPDELILALIDVESDGDPFANRENSQFHGILQMGRAAGIDTGFPDQGRRTTEELLGNGYASIEHFLKYQNRYRADHEFELEYMALLWKGGPGTLRDYKRLQREDSQEAADQYLSETFGGSPLEYLRRFRKFYDFWSSGEADHVTQIDPPDIRSSGSRGVGRAAIISDTSQRMQEVVGSIFNRLGFTLPKGCGPPSIGDIGASRTPAPSSPVRSSNRERKNQIDQTAQTVLDYIGKTYIEDLSAFTSTIHVRGLTSDSTQYTPEKTRIVEGFVASVQEDAGRPSGVAFAFQTALFDIATSYVKPLVDPVIRHRWGQRRRYNPGERIGGEKIRDPETGEILYRHHLGVDYDTRVSSGSLGVEQPCYAVSSGTVRVAGIIFNYGYAIYIDHGEGVSSRYAHLSSIAVKNGDRVTAGQIIGNCGISTTRGSGRNMVLNHTGVTTPHLHFELRINLGILQDGEMRGGIGSNSLNISIDPDPLLAVAPNPNEPRIAINPELEKLKKARESAINLADALTDPRAFVEAANMADIATAFMRGELLWDMSRGDFYEAQARNTTAQTRDISYIFGVWDFNSGIDR